MPKRLTTAFSGTLVLAGGIGLGFALIAGLAAFFAAEPRNSAGDPSSGAGTIWVEEKWPLPPDLWSVGRAFTCRPADCGSDVKLYLRAKIGFCNCATGVADDAELERIADIELIDGKAAADGPGRPITVAWMKGRSRSYAIADSSPPARSALLIGFNDRCDALVATVIVGQGRPEAVEPAVLRFLNGDIVLKWAQVTLGL